MGVYLTQCLSNRQHRTPRFGSNLPKRKKMEWQRLERPTLGPSCVGVPYRVGELMVDDEKLSSISSGLKRKNELPDRILLVAPPEVGRPDRQGRNDARGRSTSS